MDYLKSYNNWLLNVTDIQLKDELNNIKNNQEIRLRFSNYLRFGTAGLRGKIGAGTNNINVYIVAKVTQGICNYLVKNYSNASVVVAYDVRKYSDRLAKLVCEILNNNGIKVYMFSLVTPTPVLSYAVLKLNATLGINITSSHNPKEYNGYKVVNSLGCQIDNDMAKEISLCIEQVNEFEAYKTEYERLDLNDNINLLNDNLTNEFINESIKYVFDYNFNKNNFKIVYTPLNGTGKYAVTTALNRVGINNIFIPASQSYPDENFTTVPYPNPEIKQAFKEGVKLAKQKNADIILATDPDCDRVGVIVKHKNFFKLLTGDQVGVILLKYILDNSQLNKNSFVVSTYVSSPLAQKIANNYNINFYKTLTGFKNIGAKIISENKAINKAGKNGTSNFLFAYEESCGYLVSNNICDKDGITPSVLISLLAAKLKQQNKTLLHYLNDIYKQYGYILNHTFSNFYLGISGKQKINNILNRLRSKPPQKIAGLKVVEIIDYYNDTTGENSNFIEFRLSENSKVIIRPSGTEPKLKVYLTGVCKSYWGAKIKIFIIKQSVKFSIKKLSKD